MHDGLIFEATQKFEICPFLVAVLAEKLSRRSTSQVSPIHDIVCSTSYVRERHAKLLEDEGQSKEAAQQQEKKEKYLQEDKVRWAFWVLRCSLYNSFNAEG